MNNLNNVSDLDLQNFQAELQQELKRRARFGQPGQCETAAPYDRPDQAKCASDGANSGSSLSSSEVTLDNVEGCFEYHQWAPTQVEAGNIVREALVAAVKAILRVVPRGPDRTVAIRKLREARMDVNSAITHHGRF